MEFGNNYIYNLLLFEDSSPLGCDAASLGTTHYTMHYIPYDPKPLLYCCENIAVTQPVFVLYAIFKLLDAPLFQIQEFLKNSSFLTYHSNM
jgi:hypothetical protein